MTILTNKLNLPNYIADWLNHDDYDYDNNPYLLSATTLLKPIQSYWLTIRHGDTFSMDLSEKISARIGQAIHHSFEVIKSDGYIKEQRVQKEISINGTIYTVSGKFDILELLEKDIWRLRDIKTTSVWSFIYGGKDDDYQKQLSIYRWLLKDKYNIDDLAYIDFLFTDWQSSKAKQDSEYPQSKLTPSYPIKLLSLEDTEKYIYNRVTLFEKYRNIEDSQLPPCSDDELWCDPPKFAVMKKDAKRATKLCDSQEEAIQYMSNNKIKGYVEFRAAKAKRCKYCAAAGPYCKQYNFLVQSGLVDNH